MLAAVRVGFIPDTNSARSRFLNRVKASEASATKALADVIAFRDAQAQAQRIAASRSVKSGDTSKRPPATVSNGRPATSKKPKVASERIKPWTPSHEVSAAAAPTPAPQAATPAGTPVAASTEYPAAWRSAIRPSERTVQAGRAAAVPSAIVSQSPRAFMASNAEREAAAQRAAQASRSGHYDRHSLIAAAGDNARRLREFEAAEAQRMQREHRARQSA